MSLLNPKKDTVVVTGFGPFEGHPINASWEAVKLLPGMLAADKLGIALILAEIPVEYEETERRLTKLWEEHKPILMVHVGVSHKAKEINLELCASKYGYDRPDVQGKTPSHQACCIGNVPTASTNLAVEKLVSDLNSLKMKVSFCVSTDVGLYLCGFSYYTSLCLNEHNSLFVHVPDIGKPYMPDETAQGICEVIRLALAQVSGPREQIISNEI